MHPRYWLLLASLVALAAGLLSVACGGSGDGGDAPVDLGHIATATLPNPLPEVRIIDEVEAQPQGPTYTVRAGDTLSAIADQFGITAEEIIAANDIDDPRQLYVGQVLVIPGGEPVEQVLGATAEPPTELLSTPGPTRTPPPGGDCTHTVASGDVAYLIAESFGITIEELAALNNTTVDNLRSLIVGDGLSVPC